MDTGKDDDDNASMATEVNRLSTPPTPGYYVAPVYDMEARINKPPTSPKRSKQIRVCQAK
jgi:hypothetical protein